MKDEDEEEYDEENQLDFELQMADSNFTESQLQFMNKHYGNSRGFMFSFGLKMFNDDDCEEAKAILDAFMSDGNKY